MKESLVPLGSEEAPEREKLDPEIAVEEEVTAKAISLQNKIKKKKEKLPLGFKKCRKRIRKKSLCDFFVFFVLLNSARLDQALNNGRTNMRTSSVQESGRLYGLIRL